MHTEKIYAIGDIHGCYARCSCGWGKRLCESIVYTGKEGGVSMLKIIKAHAVKNLCYIAAEKMIPKGIVVHSTGANNPYLKRYVEDEYVVEETKDVIWFIYPFSREFKKNIIVFSDIIKTSPYWQKDIYNPLIKNKTIVDLLKNNKSE